MILSLFIGWYFLCCCTTHHGPTNHTLRWTQSYFGGKFFYWSSSTLHFLPFSCCVFTCFLTLVTLHADFQVTPRVYLLNTLAHHFCLFILFSKILVSWLYYARPYEPTPKIFLTPMYGNRTTGDPFCPSLDHGWSSLPVLFRYFCFITQTSLFSITLFLQNYSYLMRPSSKSVAFTTTQQWP